MVDSVFILLGALGALGVAVYGLVEAFKAAASKQWRKKKRAGRFAVRIAPLCLGAGLSAVALGGAMDLLAALVGFDSALPCFTLGARALFGIAAGTLSTQIYAIARKRVKNALGNDEQS
jgi:hypothetical protein